MKGRKESGTPLPWDCDREWPVKVTRRAKWPHYGQQLYKGSDKEPCSRGGGCDCKIPLVLIRTCVFLVHGSLINTAFYLPEVVHALLPL